MRKMKIVADSSANLMTLHHVPFASAPLKIRSAEREFVDDHKLDLDEMLDYFYSYKGKSQISPMMTASLSRALTESRKLRQVSSETSLATSRRQPSMPLVIQ